MIKVWKEKIQLKALLSWGWVIANMNSLLCNDIVGLHTTVLQSSHVTSFFYAC